MAEDMAFNVPSLDNFLGEDGTTSAAESAQE
jgi:hypothetical protein